MPQAKVEPNVHWDQVYGSKSPDELSWFQREAAISLHFLRAAGATPASRIIDIGGGTSSLPRDLLNAGYKRITVLDISGKALERARLALGERRGQITWIEADVTRTSLDGPYDIWHDRAVLHFLTDPDDRARYREVLLGALAAEGQAIIATFAVDGPERCSGLPVVRYDATSITEALGPHFELVEIVTEQHVTPGGSVQRFVWFRLRRRDAGKEAR